MLKRIFPLAWGLLALLLAVKGAVAQSAASPHPLVEKPPRTDLCGDPLPEGAVARMGTVRFRHAGTIGGIAYSPDGKTLASCSVGMIHLWDMATGRELWRVAHASTKLAFSPDGKLLAGGGERGVVLRDAATGKERSVLHDGIVHALAFAPDGKTLASVSLAPGGGEKVRLWDLATGRERQCFENSVAAAFSPDGKALAVGTTDGVVRLCNDSTSREICRFPAKRETRIERILFARDGKTLAVCVRLHWPETQLDVVVRDLLTARERTRFSLGLLSFDLSPDGRLLAATTADHGVQLWDLATGEKLRDRFPGSMPACRSLAFSPDGRLLACADLHQALHLWDVDGGREVRPVEAPTEGVSVVVLSPDGRTVASLTRLQPVVRLWETTTGRLCGEIADPHNQEAFYAMALAPGDPPRIVLQGYKLAFWDVRARKLQEVLKDKGRAEALAVADGGRYLFLGEWDGRTSVLDTALSRIVHRFEGHDPAGVGVCAVAPSADGKLLAVAGWQGTSGGSRLPVVKVWNVADGKEHAAFRNQKIVGTCVALTPDGQVLAANDENGGVRFWDTATGRELRRVARFGQVSALAFAPDGRTLAEGRTDGVVRLLETATGGERQAFPGHRGVISSLAWSTDGRLLVSGSRDTTALVWDATGPPSAGPLRAVRLSHQEWERLWKELAGPTSPRTHRAVWTLAQTSEQGVPFVRERLRPAPVPEPQRVVRLLADLDNEQFSVREKAGRELGELRTSVEPALRKVLAGKPSLEVRRQVERLLQSLSEWSPEELRGLRAVEALEHSGTREACALLKVLAAGAPAARLTREAKAALERVARRSTTP
jgi:WD40 repeat protein